MNAEAQRIAIAEALGWKRIDPFKCGKELVDWAVWDRDGKRASLLTCTLPDYLHDLGAMHEAEKMFLNNQDRGTYEFWLTDAVGVRIVAHAAPATGEIFKIASATAAQRAEAFLRTIGKWVETPPAPPTFPDDGNTFQSGPDIVNVK